jgi:hypothetical protein
MVTSRQVRAARALLQWDQVMLADKAVVALSAVQRLEQGKPVREATAQAVERALTKAGIAFVSGDGQEGAILKRRSAR